LIRAALVPGTWEAPRWIASANFSVAPLN